MNSSVKALTLACALCTAAMVLKAIPELKARAAGRDSQTLALQDELRKISALHTAASKLEDSPLNLLPMEAALTGRVNAIRAHAPERGVFLQSLRPQTSSSGPGLLGSAKEHPWLLSPVIDLAASGTYTSLEDFLRFCSEELAPDKGVVLSDASLEGQAFEIRFRIFGRSPAQGKN